MCRGRFCFCSHPWAYPHHRSPCLWCLRPLALVSAAHGSRLVSSQECFCALLLPRAIVNSCPRYASRSHLCLAFKNLHSLSTVFSFHHYHRPFAKGASSHFFFFFAFYIFASVVSQLRAPSLLHSRIQISSFSRAHPIPHLLVIASGLAIYIEIHRLSRSNPLFSR